MFEIVAKELWLLFPPVFGAAEIFGSMGVKIFEFLRRSSSGAPRI